MLPKPAHGLQIGTLEFAVPAGEERQWCYDFKLPSDVDIDVVRFDIWYLAGSHHMGWFETDKDAPDYDEDCFARMPFMSPEDSVRCSPRRRFPERGPRLGAAGRRRVQAQGAPPARPADSLRERRDAADAVRSRQGAHQPRTEPDPSRLPPTWGRCSPTT